MHITSATGGTFYGGHTPYGVQCAMSAHAIPCKVHRRGGSLAIMLVREVRHLLNWRAGAVVGVRVCGDKLIVEKIPLDRIAVIRTGEPQPYAANLDAT